MWRNYFKTALRNLWKHKFYSAINILGLALGMACFLFILIYVKDELSYDRYHEQAEQIYRIHFFGKIFEQDVNIPQVGDPWGPMLVEDYPEVAGQVRLRERGFVLIRYEDKSFREERVIFADSTFFEVFSIPLLQGEPQQVLREPNTVVLTPAMAEKYFGRGNPLGKTLTVDGEHAYRVTGVMEPTPANTHFHFDFLFSMASLEESRSNAWMSFNFHTYLLLRDGADPKALEAQFPQLARTHLGSQLEQYIGTSYDDFLAGGNELNFSLFPLTRIHLYSHTDGELAPAGDIQYVYIFSFIGLFILLLACVNFMNLSTARASGRAREVGMRKVVGARRRQIVEQFLSESILLCFLSLFIAAGLLFLLLPHFNQLSGKLLTVADITRPWIWAAMLGVTLLVGVLAGSYPAFFLSGFRPIRVLKGKLSRKAGDVWVRNGLVVFQFAITVGLIAGTLIINDQLQFIQNKRLGFDKERLLIINDAYALGNSLDAFKEELKRHPQVVNVTRTSYLPTPSSRNNTGHFLGRNPKAKDTHVVQSWRVDHDYVSTMEMELVQGRDFSREFSSDSTAAIINEEAARIFGLENPLGQEISTFSSAEGDIVTYRVIGILKDFHFESMRQKIGPLIMYLGRSSNFLAIRMKGTVAPFLQEMKGKWDAMASGQPFDYNFLDDRFDNMYEAEVRIGQIISLFTLLAIVIACLGLFGLATFTAEQRTKEIGVRKVMGAPMTSIFVLLTTQFTRWVLLANLLALPLAYYAMRHWLQGFEYRIDFSYYSLVLAALVALVIALITVSYQALRAARRNPVEALRYE